jgi:N-acyl-phosphatidylethanolamine-hydrolysing phospholipase D
VASPVRRHGHAPEEIVRRALHRLSPLTWLVLVVLVAAPAALWPWHAGSAAARVERVPAHHLAVGFRNLNPDFPRPSTWARLRSYVRRLGPALRAQVRASAVADGAEPPPPALAPAPATDWAALRDDPRPATVTWVGHSTLLVRMDGVTFLTDPQWSEVAGPFGGRIGAHRYTPPGIPFEALPPIDFVLISHDHYDHLDEPTVERLARVHHPRFVVPLGIKAWLSDRGITDAVELDWGESTTIGSVRIVCTPAQHYSGRTPVDQGRRLWASWVVLGPDKRFYFAGDSGYYRHFREIGDAFGPFDLAALPIGSYRPRETTRGVHTSPEEALQAWLDLRGRRFVGIHWGTFALAHEPPEEPPRRLAAEVRRRGVDPEVIWTLQPGETRAW